MSKTSNSQKPNGNQNDGVWWLITIGCFCTGAFWWAGLVLMFLNINGKLPPLSRKKREQDEQHFESSWGQPVQPKPEPGKKKKRRGLAALITGICIGGVGILQLASTFWDIIRDIFWGSWSVSWIPFYLEDGAIGLALLVAGAITAGVGYSKMRKDKLFRRYQAMVAGRGAVSIHAMADALNVSYAKACRQLQEMIDSGWFGSSAYIDLNKGRLLLDGSGLDCDEPESQPEPEPTPEQTISEEEKILRQIRADNDLIDHPEISRKIDRIEELTRRIFSYIREKPEKASELRSFLNYYLPQTLKILETYARLEAQGVEGDNITAAKSRIEGMMDTLVESYERQLDKLFEGDVLDITTDIEVMEAMLARDGLTADELLKKTK